MTNVKPVLLLLIAGVLVLSACTAPLATVDEISLATDQTQPQKIEPTLDDGEEPDPTAIDPAGAVPAAKATARPEMEATPPDSVKLAAGQLQLVEFFAYW